MNCPKCGATLQDDMLVCPTCGTPLPVQSESQSDFANAAPTTAPAKSKKGLIIGLAAGAVAIIALIVVLIVFVFAGGPDGTYECSDLKALGITCTLKVDGDEFTLKMSAYGETETQKGKIKFDGKKVTMTVDGESEEGTYNKSDETIEFEGMTFKKK